MTTIGTAVLQIIPSLDGVTKAVESQLGGLAAQGKAAGRQLSDGIASGVDAAAKRVEQASAKVQAARNKEADAAGKVKTAEAQLETLREKGVTDAGKLTAAEEKVAKAKRDHETASEKLTQAAKDEATAQDKLTEAQKRQTRATDDATSSGGRFSRMLSSAESQLGGVSRAVDGLAGDVGGLGGQMTEAGDSSGGGFMAGFAGRLSGLASKAGPIGVALAAAVGLGAVFGGALAGEVAAGFDRDMARRTLQVQLGLDDSSVRSVSEAVANAYKNNFGASIEELNGLAAAVIKNGLGSAEDPLGLQKIIEQFDTVATVSGYAGEELSTAVGTLVKSGVAADATAALDLITAAAQSGIDVHGDLLDTLTEYGVQFQKIGIDGQQAMGLVAQLLDGGARNADLAADAIKEFTIRSIDGSKGTIDAYSAIGLSAEDTMQKLALGGPDAFATFDVIVDKLNAIADPVKRGQLQVALFGTQAEDLGQALQNLDPSSAVDAIGQVDGAVQSASDTLGSGATSGFQALGRTLEVLRGNFQDFLAKAFGPMAQQISTWITNQLPKLSDWFTNTLIPAVQRFGSAFGGQWLDSVKSAWPEIQKFGEGVQRLFTAAAPVLKVVGTAVGGLVLGFLKLAGILGPAAWQGLTFLVNTLASIHEKVWPAVKSATDSIGSAFQGVADRVGQVKDWVVEKWDSIVTFVGALPGRITSVTSGLWDGLKKGLVGALNWVSGKWNSFADTFKVHIPGTDVDFGLPHLPTIGEFARGGHTGNVPFDQVAGVVHGAEFVIRADSTRRLENAYPGLLDFLNNNGRLPLPGYAAGGLVTGTSQLRDIISEKFGITDIGGWRPQDQYGEHSTGRALDVMVGNNRGKGDAVKKFALDNAEAIDLKWVIWQQHLTYPGGGGYDMPDRGSPTANHMDHVHIFSGPRIAAGLRGELLDASNGTQPAASGPGAIDATSTDMTAAEPTPAATESGSGVSVPTSFSGMSRWGLDGLGAGIGTTSSGSDLSVFGKAAGDAVSGQVSSALSVFGVGDSPGWLQGLSKLASGFSVGSSPTPAATSTWTTPTLPLETMHGSRAGQQPGPAGPVYNIRTSTVEDAFLHARRRENERSVAKLSQY